MERMIKRYVKEVLKYLPIRDRRQARTIITATIYERLEDYTDGLRPMKKDVKAVLRELGSPAKAAYAYYEDFHEPLFRVPDFKSLSAHAVQIATVLAFVLVGIGVVQLLVGSGTVISLVLGAVLGIVTQFYQVVGQVRADFMTLPAER